MKKIPINPWQWQETFGFSQAVAVSGGQQHLYCAGQAATSAEGAVLHKEDMPAQIQLAVENVHQVLTNGGYTWSNVVHLRIYTTDMDRFFSAYEEVLGRLAAVTPKPAITVVGVNRLAFAELLVEIEVTAVK